mmetsp:Transcript_27178/g.70511  ORF Transcript_27178/g.70511 Transcript_27178/m.70511 type:complete len:281 (+) Transcript_27178:159-1001(+)
MRLLSCIRWSSTSRDSHISAAFKKVGFRSSDDGAQVRIILACRRRSIDESAARRELDAPLDGVRDFAETGTSRVPASSSSSSKGSWPIISDRRFSTLSESVTLSAGSALTASSASCASTNVHSSRTLTALVGLRRSLGSCGGSCVPCANCRLVERLTAALRGTAHGSKLSARTESSGGSTWWPKDAVCRARRNDWLLNSVLYLGVGVRQGARNRFRLLLLSRASSTVGLVEQQLACEVGEERVSTEPRPRRSVVALSKKITRDMPVALGSSTGGPVAKQT